MLTKKGNIYELSSTDGDSQLMKNSEWGAMAYLSCSQYGRNGEEIAISNTVNYAKNTKIYGDAVREISTVGMGNTSWNADYFVFPGINDITFVLGNNITKYFSFVHMFFKLEQSS